MFVQPFPQPKGAARGKGRLQLPTALPAPWDLVFARSHNVEAIREILPGFLFITISLE